MNPRLRIAARDPGAANHLSALLREPGLFDAVSGDIWITGNIAGYFDGTGFPVRIFDHLPGRADLAAEWDRDPADAVITGTSHYEPFDELFWEIGRERGIPSLAVVDYWSNLGPRFSRGRPGTVGVIDDGQRREAEELGLTPAIVTGHPALAAITAAPARTPDGRVRILFVSERIADDVAEGVNDDYGFTETDSCRLVLDAARQAADAGHRTEITIKLHPYNDEQRFLTALGPLPQNDRMNVTIVTGRQPIQPLIEANDIVTGMASVAMVEAALVGRPVLSVQPGLKRENMFIPGIRGYADTALDGESAVSSLVELIGNADARSAAIERLAPFRENIAGSGNSGIRQWLATILTGRPVETAQQVS